MSVTNSNYVKRATLSTGTDAIATLIHILDEDHITVIRERAGIQTTLTITTHYTVTDVGESLGCTVTMVGQAADDEITIIRNVPLTQTATFAKNSQFNPTTTTQRLDWLTMITQQLQEQINRCFRLPSAEAGQDFGQLISLLATARASKAVGFDGAGAFAIGDSGDFGGGIISGSKKQTIASGTDTLCNITLPDNGNAILRVYGSIDGRGYALEKHYLLSSQGGTLAVQTGDELPWNEDQTGSEYLAYNVSAGIGGFSLQVDCDGLTASRSVSVRWRIEAFNEEGDVGFTAL